MPYALKGMVVYSVKVVVLDVAVPPSSSPAVPPLPAGAVTLAGAAYVVNEEVELCEADMVSQESVLAA